MNANIQEAFLSIFDSEEAVKEFMQLDDIEDMYEFCLKFKGGYTQAEFEEFMMQYADMCSVYSRLAGDYALTDEEAKLVAGGITAKQWTATSLAAISVLTGTGTNIKAAPAQSSSEYVEFVPKTTEKKEEQVVQEEQEEKSFTQKIKEKLENALNIAKNNKGKLGLGALLIATFLWYVLRQPNNGGVPSNKQIRDGIEERVKDQQDALMALLNSPNATEEDKADAHEELERLNRELNWAEDIIKSRDSEGFFSKLGAKLGAASALLKPIVLLGSGFSAIWNWTMYLVHASATKLGDVKMITDALKSATNLYYTLMQSGHLISSRIDPAKFDAEARRTELLHNLETVKGQEKAKKEVIRCFDRIAAKRSDVEKGIIKASKARPDIIVFNGTAGVGKTMCAKFLADALAVSHDGPFEFSAPARIWGKTQKDFNQALFGFNGSDFMYTERSSLNVGRYAFENPQGVAIINEYDKLGVGQLKHPLDEIFRGILDDGKVENPYSPGSDINFNQFTFIFTTNESNDSLRITDKVDVHDLNLDDNGNAKNEEDPTITHVNHDGSFLTRLNVIPFDQLKHNEYEEISDSVVSDYLGNYLTVYKDLNHKFRLKSGIHYKVAKYTAAQHRGARPISLELAGNFAAVIHEAINARRREIQSRLAKELKKPESEIQLSEEPKDFAFDLDFNDEKGEFEIKVTSYGNFSDENYKNLLKK